MPAFLLVVPGVEPGGAEAGFLQAIEQQPHDGALAAAPGAGDGHGDAGFRIAVEDEVGQAFRHLAVAQGVRVAGAQGVVGDEQAGDACRADGFRFLGLADLPSGPQHQANAGQEGHIGPGGGQAGVGAGGLLVGGAGLALPGLAAVAGGQDDAVLAHGPAVEVVGLGRGQQGGLDAWG